MAATSNIQLPLNGSDDLILHMSDGRHITISGGSYVPGTYAYLTEQCISFTARDGAIVVKTWEAPGSNQFYTEVRPQPKENHEKEPEYIEI
jgi:hypothetical protein